MLRIDMIAHQSKGKDFYPKCRIGLTLFLMFFSLFTNSLILYGALILSASFTIFLLSPIKLKQFLLLVLFPMGFVIFSSVIIWIQVDLKTAAFTMIRSLNGLLLLYSFTLTIPLYYFTAFLRCLFLPEVFIELYELTYRFIFIIMEEAADMILAQQMRFGFFSFKHATKNLSLCFSALFIRVFSRFRDFENAAQLRHYN